MPERRCGGAESGGDIDVPGRRWWGEPEVTGTVGGVLPVIIEWVLCWTRRLVSKDAQGGGFEYNDCEGTALERLGSWYWMGF